MLTILTISATFSAIINIIIVDTCFIKLLTVVPFVNLAEITSPVYCVNFCYTKRRQIVQQQICNFCPKKSSATTNLQKKINTADPQNQNCKFALKSSDKDTPVHHLLQTR